MPKRNKFLRNSDQFAWIIWRFITASRIVKFSAKIEGVGGGPRSLNKMKEEGRTDGLG